MTALWKCETTRDRGYLIKILKFYSDKIFIKNNLFWKIDLVSVVYKNSSSKINCNGCVTYTLIPGPQIHWPVDG